MAEITSEHRARARSEAQEILDRVLRGDPKPVRRVKNPDSKWHYVSPTGQKRGENLRNRGPVHDYGQILEVFKVEQTIADTARKMGIHRDTVRAALKQLGVPSPPPGRPKRK